MSYGQSPGEEQEGPAGQGPGFGVPPPYPGQAGPAGPPGWEPGQQASPEYGPPGYGAPPPGPPPSTYRAWGIIAAVCGVLFNIILGLPTALIGSRHGKKVTELWASGNVQGAIIASSAVLHWARIRASYSANGSSPASAPIAIVRPGPYANSVGIIQVFGYQVRKPNAAQVAMQHIAATRPGAWLFARTLHHIDRGLLTLSRGQVTLPEFVAGIPVLTVTTTGARTGQRRTSPLLGVPAGEDIAVIGTSFGQPRTPGWYHNMRADPKVEVTYRNKTIRAIAREAGDDERQAIWDRARTIYAGYEAYASRIKSREIHIMILSAEGSQ